MLKLTPLAIVISVALLALTTGCSQTNSSQNASTSNQGSSTVSASNTSKVALASHLKQIGANFYGTYWCPYCNKQKEIFGQPALNQINYVECDAKGKNPRPDLCKKANINSLPTWEINGQQFPGLLSLEELADLSNYKGERNFGN